VAAGAAAARLEKEAQDRVEKRLEEGRKEQAREKREMERQRLSFLREQAKFEKQKEEASRRSTRLAADAPAAQPRSIITRFCMCKKPESECDTHEMVQCIGCDDYFHPTCLVMTQHEITDERFILECVLHTPQAIAARERQAALLPPAATPSVSRDVSAAVALAGLTGRGEAEVASVRSKPLNWPRDVVYTARNVFTAPGSEEEKRRRLMERRTVIPGVEIFQLPVSHPVGLAGALGADGAQPACGVRATSPFAKDAVIGHYTGLVREKTERDLESKYVMVIPAGFPAFDLKERDEPYAIMVIDAKTCGNEMRFINDYRGNAHAPNVKFEERALRSADGTTEELIMAIVAERDIAVGEELTCAPPAAGCPLARADQLALLRAGSSTATRSSCRGRQKLWIVAWLAGARTHTAYGLAYACYTTAHASFGRNAHANPNAPSWRGQPHSLPRSSSLPRFPQQRAAWRTRRTSSRRRAAAAASARAVRRARAHRSHAASGQAALPARGCASCAQQRSAGRAAQPSAARWLLAGARASPLPPARARGAVLLRR
jgi:hypothetical protein